MRKRTWIIAGLLLAAAATPGAAPAESSGVPPAGSALAIAATPPPGAWPEDPADSLYREARTALSRQQYERAAELFRRITERHPRSAYAPDALYWEAFSLYRMGGSSNLREALERLERQLRSHPDARTRGDADALATRIRGELARQGDAAAAERVAREASRAPAQCSEGDADVRTAALNALLHLDAEQAVPVLKRVLERRDRCSAALREKAVFLVAQQRTAETEDILLSAAQKDPSREVRKQAVFWLSEVPTERAVRVLTDILHTSKDSEVREQAIFALSQHPSAAAGRVLRDAAEGPGLLPELREKAIFWISERNSAESSEFLRGLYARLDEPKLKEQVIFALSEMEGRGNERWLLSIARNEREPMQLRKQALFWAGEAGAPLASILELYENTPSRELRVQAIFVLSQRDEPAAIGQLISLARRERDPELRKQALFWLAESGDPRAAQVLREIIDG